MADFMMKRNVSGVENKYCIESKEVSHRNNMVHLLGHKELVSFVFQLPTPLCPCFRFSVFLARVDFQLVERLT